MLPAFSSSAETLVSVSPSRMCSAWQTASSRRLATWLSYSEYVMPQPWRCAATKPMVRSRRSWLDSVLARYRPLTTPGTSPSGRGLGKKHRGRFTTVLHRRGGIRGFRLRLYTVPVGSNRPSPRGLVMDDVQHHGAP